MEAKKSVNYDPLLYDTYRYMNKNKPPPSTYEHGYKWPKKSSNKKNYNNTYRVLSESNLSNNKMPQQAYYNNDYPPQHAFRITSNPTVLEYNTQPTEVQYANQMYNENVQRNENIDQQLSNLANQHIVVSSEDPRPLHWMTFPQEKMPDRIYEAKKRLNQIHPNTPPNLVRQKQSESENDVSKSQQMATLKQYVHANNNNNETANPPTLRHWFYHDQPPTPETIRESRVRFGDERYNGTSTWTLREKSNPPQPVENKDEQTYETNEQPNNERAKSAPSKRPATAVPSKSVVYNHYQPKAQEQIDQLQKHLVQEQEQAQEPFNIPQPQFDYNKAVKVNDQYDSNNNFANINEYADQYDQLNSQSADEYYNNLGYNPNESLAAFDNVPVQVSYPAPQGSKYLAKRQSRPQTSIGIQRGANSNDLRATNIVDKSRSQVPIPFEMWMASATDKEKQAVLNMLRSIDGTQPRPPSGRKTPMLNLNGFTYGIRTRPPTASRKLGQTRNFHKLPCSTCERTLVKQHVAQMRRCPDCGNNVGSNSVAVEKTNNESLYIDNNPCYNLTSHFTNSMQGWRGQYVIFPQFNSEAKDLQRLYAQTRAKSSVR